MVLSLVDLSLITISNGIKDGTIQNPHMLPPKLRQRVLDTVLKRGFINDPKCLAILSSVEFLDGMTSISTSAGNTYDVEYLRRLINSMGAILPNGETVGAAIKKLDLTVYGIMSVVNYCLVNEFRVERSSFPTVSQLIANCPNVTSTAFRGVESDGPMEEEYLRDSDFEEPWLPCLLNQSDVCNRVVENLNELSVSNWMKVVDSGLPIVNFKQLTILKLSRCIVDIDVWPEFLRKIPTLEHLHMIDLHYDPEDEKGLDFILPFSMPHLKSLEIIGIRFHTFFCNKDFVDNLIGCPELRQVDLLLDQRSTDEESLARLAAMDIDLKMKTRLFIEGNDKPAYAAVIDSSSYFKIVSYFHEMMESFDLIVTEEWSPLLLTALENVIDTCFNLTSFKISLIQYRSVPGQEKISKEDMKRINAALIRFFNAKERAMQLKELHLMGNFDEAVVSAVFQNSLNLVQLEFWNCPALRDQHLIEWVSRDGGKLTHLNLSGCNNITSEGIITILARSAERLLEINAYACQSSGGRNWKALLKNHCPNAQIVLL